MGDYQSLEVWQRSMDLAEAIYKLIEKLPLEERFALCDQMRRAAVSIPSNIAEGKGRNSDKELLFFLKIAMGSKCELETQLLLCERLCFLDKDDTFLAWRLCEIVGQKLNSLMNIIKSSVIYANNKTMRNHKRKGKTINK